jgi:hypothetical protein
MTRREELRDLLPIGVYVDDYSPGDGVTRYRFFTEDIDYFAGDGVFTALGWGEALVFAKGLQVGENVVIKKIKANERLLDEDGYCHVCGGEGWTDGSAELRRDGRDGDTTCIGCGGSGKESGKGEY